MTIKNIIINTYKFYEKNLHFGLLILVSLLILLPNSPLITQIPLRDSGVFMYGGWRITEGEIPYKDFWDHKPPIIFFINAFGYLIGFGSRWGIWITELLNLFIAATFSYLLLKKIFSKKIATLATIFWIVSLPGPLQGGNFTTEYTLSFQFISLYLFYKFLTEKKYRYLFWIGLFGGIAFMLKQNAIGIWVSIFLGLILAKFNFLKSFSLKNSIVNLITGFTFVIIPIILYFFANSSMSEFFDAAFVYNFVYTDTGISFLEKIFNSIKYIVFALNRFVSGVILLSLVTTLVFLCFKVYKEYRKKLVANISKENKIIYFIFFIGTFIDFLLISLSNRNYPHYYLTLFPYIGFFVANLFSLFFLLTQKTRKIFKFSLVIIIFIFSIILNHRSIINIINLLESQKPLLEIVNYIEKNSNTKDTLLLIGAETSINFMAKRKSPTRYVYQYPLYEFKKYATENKILEFLESIKSQRPKIVIDTLGRKENELINAPISEEFPNLQKSFIDYIKENYYLNKEFSNGWIAWQLKI